MKCRVLPHAIGSGPENMATDEALLDAVDQDPSAAVFRTYEWSAPTLSLGYFQPIAAVRGDPRWLDRPIVRRPSGGGALWHDRELTYALIVPRSHPSAARASDLYRAVHAAVVDLLDARGILARRRGQTTPRTAEERPFLCFLDRDPEDVLVANSKVVGSAQRRRPHGLLQHGSLLFERSETTPELPGLIDLSPAAREFPEWKVWLARGLPKALGFDPEPGDLRPEEAGAARRLEREVYSASEWTERR